MVFMEDSARGAKIANDLGVDAGLHVNFTLAFSDPNCSLALRREQGRIRRFLKCNKYALLLYNPFLRGIFQIVYQTQAEEFRRLYGRPPSHIDGHQHMHLCTNMLVDKVIPSGEKVRRSFSFWPGEKSTLNIRYRKWVDSRLENRHRVTDYFFSLHSCLRTGQTMRIAELAARFKVELMTHPERPQEAQALLGDQWTRLCSGLSDRNILRRLDG